MTRRIVMLFVALATVFLGGCAASKEGEVSSIPWNRPQQWEGSGVLGGYGGMGSGSSGRGQGYGF